MALVCLSVTLVIHAQTVQHIEMHFAPYDMQRQMRAVSMAVELLMYTLLLWFKLLYFP